MNDHFEELIHDGIDQLTARSALPAGLADRARGQVRRRQHQVRAAVAAGTAAAAAVAVIAATSAGSAGTTPSPSPSIALLAKVERAVASKAGSAPVLQVRTTFSGRKQLPPSDPFSSVPFYQGGMARAEILWTHAGVFKSDLLNAKGRTVTATRTAGGPKRGISTHVDYANRTWWRVSLNWSIVGQPLHQCTLLPLGPVRPRDWSPRSLAKDIKHAIACGRVKVAGRQQVDGVDAIKLKFTSRLSAVSLSGNERVSSRQTLWVDPDSYLPVRYRSTLTWTGHQSASVQSDFRWLPATRFTLAKLQLTVPSGFRHVRAPIVYAPFPNAP